jgi:hypothetical protein
VVVGPAGSVLLEPLASHRLEARLGACKPPRPLQLPGRTRVDALGQQLARLVPALARPLDGDLGPDAAGEQFLNAREAVLPAPVLGPVGSDVQVEALLVEEALGLVPRPGVADGHAGQRHQSGGTSAARAVCTPRGTPDSGGMSRTPLKPSGEDASTKSPLSPVSLRRYGTS